MIGTSEAEDHFRFPQILTASNDICRLIQNLGNKIKNETASVKVKPVSELMFLKSFESLIQEYGSFHQGTVCLISLSKLKT